ncbi:hypothetical protein tb265_42570 [Gemmatimonadetes bacterium T265]|nr:hypothetical protein tb265_42570 [Gemmatimonadetes bacterium T265]
MGAPSAAVALLLAAPAGAQHPARGIPAGTYMTTLRTADVAALLADRLVGPWTVTFDSTGHFTVEHGESQIGGTTRPLPGDQVSFNDDMGPGACGTPPGMYSYAVRGDTLTLRKVSDACDARAAVLTARPLTRASAGTGLPVAAQPPAPGTAAPSPPPAPPPPDWYLRDPATDGVPGAAVRRALREALAGQAPKRAVLVAVIDGGFDTAHAALRPALWRNPGEVPGNGRDDDGDGYVDDVFGWNFLGAPTGRNVNFLQFEITRIAARCRAGGQPGVGVAFSCDSAARLYAADSARAATTLARVDGLIARLDSARTLLARTLGVLRDSLTRARVAALPGGGAPAAGDSVGRARAFYLLVHTGVSDAMPDAVLDAMIRDRHADLVRRATVGYDLTTDPPTAVLGNVRGLGRRYGNGDVGTTTAAHGTAVAGLIAGAPGDSGVAGVAPFARVLMVRAAMSGDERDEDVANAIRYAVDRGARVINMSFGKLYSPEKPTVDSAVQYAAAKGVLLVHSAMNEASDNDRAPA